MKTFPTEIRNQYYSQNKFVCNLVEIHLLSGTLYYTNAPYPIDVLTLTAPDIWGPNTYTALGDFMGFGAIAEDFDVKVGKVSVFLSGFSEAAIALTNPNVSGRRVVIYEVFLDPTTGQPILSPILKFDGQIQNVTITESLKTCSITLDCSSLFADFERIACRRTSLESDWHFQQNIRFDTTMEMAGLLKGMELKWGRK